MAAPNLTPIQRDDIMRRLAAGEHSADIAAAVGCSIANVKYHARKKKPKIEAVRETRITEAITRGLSEVDARVAELESLYWPVKDDLAQSIYGTDIKMSASGKAIEVPAFKGAQFAQARGLLDDIAKERNGRRTNVSAKVGLNFADLYALAHDADAGAEDSEPGG